MDQDAHGPKSAPEEVWEAVKEAYLAGMPGAECCRRFGVGKTALRDRAARDGWRRCDQVWSPPGGLDPWDEGVELEQSIGGDLDQLDFCELAHVAVRRMMRAVLRGDAVAVLRWHRVRLVMDAEHAEVMAALEADDAAVWARQQQREREAMVRREAEQALAAAATWAPDPDHPDSPDTVFGSGGSHSADPRRRSDVSQPGL